MQQPESGGRVCFAMAVLLLLSWGQARAQIGISLTTDRNKYLRYEPIKCRLVLRNNSGNTLAFGGRSARRGSLRFMVQTADDLPVRKLDPKADLAAGLILGPGETKELVVGLNTLYDMQKESVYTARAQVGHYRLKNDYRSSPVTIEVRAGVPLWQRTVGLPTASPAGPIPSRDVTLLLFHEDAGDVYALRVEDKEVVYGIVRLGPRISGADPECDVDAVSNVHILLPTKPRLYAYRVYDCSVNLKQSKHYLAEESIPRLHRDPDIGRIMVTGGRRAVEGVDFEVEDNRQVDPGTAPRPAPPARAPGTPARQPRAETPEPE